MLRSAEADPHIQQGGQGYREVRGLITEVNGSVPSRAPEFVAPSASPVARFGGQQPSGGAADFKALLR